jgi:hypothetical protein
VNYSRCVGSEVFKSLWNKVRDQITKEYEYMACLAGIYGSVMMGRDAVTLGFYGYSETLPKYV